MYYSLNCVGRIGTKALAAGAEAPYSKLTRHIPEDRFASGKRDSEIVKLSDMIAEYALLSAQVDLVRRDPRVVAFKW